MQRVTTEVKIFHYQIFITVNIKNNISIKTEIVKKFNSYTLEDLIVPYYYLVRCFYGVMASESKLLRDREDRLGVWAQKM